MFIKHLMDTQKEASGNVTEDTVSFAIENYDVTGVVQDDTFKIVSVDFSDANVIAAASRCRRRTATSNPYQISFREVTDEIIQILSCQSLI